MTLSDHDEITELVSGHSHDLAFSAYFDICPLKVHQEKWSWFYVIAYFDICPLKVHWENGHDFMLLHTLI